MEQTKLKPLEEYIEYLKDEGVTFSERFGLTVSLYLKSIDYTDVYVYEHFEGKLEIFDYVGRCYTTKPPAVRLAKVLSKKFPEYDFRVEPYASYEIDVHQVFDFTTIDDLHLRVCRLAKTIDECISIARETLGDRFSRS